MVASLFAVTLMSLATSVSAAKPVYFHKAGIDRATFVSDFSECNVLAGGVRAPHYQLYSPNMVSLAANSFFSGFFGSREKRRIMENVLRTCMADKGYRRVEATPALKQELNKLDEQKRLDRLFELALSPKPIGTMLPR